MSAIRLCHRMPLPGRRSWLHSDAPGMLRSSPATENRQTHSATGISPFNPRAPGCFELCVHQVPSPVVRAFVVPLFLQSPLSSPAPWLKKPTRRRRPLLFSSELLLITRPITASQISDMAIMTPLRRRFLTDISGVTVVVFLGNPWCNVGDSDAGIRQFTPQRLGESAQGELAGRVCREPG